MSQENTNPNTAKKRKMHRARLFTIIGLSLCCVVVTIYFLVIPVKDSAYQSSEIPQSDTAKQSESEATQNSSAEQSNCKTTQNGTAMQSNNKATAQSRNVKKAGNEAGSKNAGVTAEKKLLCDVRITIPKDLAGSASETSNLSGNKRIKSIEKNNDGSVAYVIKGSEYNDFINELRNETEKSINTLTDGTYQSISKVEHNANFSQVTITAKKDLFESSFDSAAPFACGVLCLFYQKFDTSAPQKVTIQIKDAQTNKVFKTANYPQ